MRVFRWLLLALMIFCIVTQVLIFGVSRENWFDVSFSLETVNLLRENGPLSIDWRSYDVHAPTFYYVLYGWSFLNPGMSEYQWGMELSVVFGVIFLTCAFIGLTRFFGRSGAWATVMLSMCSTYLHYGTEVRMYMLVLMLSAIVFAGIAEGLERKWWRWAAYASLLLMPLTHYISVCAAPFFIVLYVVVQRKRGASGKVEVHRAIRMALAAVIGTVIALQMAMPQMARTQGTWFQPPGMGSFISAVFYAFFTLDELLGNIVGAAAQIAYVLFVLLFSIIAMRVVWRLMSKRLDERDSVETLMFLTALYPFGMLAFLSMMKVVSGGGGFANLYHHRFFLVVTWMCAASLFVMLFRLVERKRVWRVAVPVVFGVMMVMLVSYVAGSHHELENMMDATPCTDEVVVIGHESPFSSLPYEVYAREHGCRWENFISTAISRERANGGGYDAIWGSQEVYWNLTLPSAGFFYVQSTEKVFPLEDREWSVVAEDDGIWLLDVRKVDKADVSVSFA